MQAQGIDERDRAGSSTGTNKETDELEVWTEPSRGTKARSPPSAWKSLPANGH